MHIGRIFLHSNHTANNMKMNWIDALAHERLAIVDVESGAQPLYSPSGNQILAVNGEIYNHRELEAPFEGDYAGLVAAMLDSGSAVVDLDGDGWLDIAVAPYRGRFRLYRNRGREIWPRHRSLTVRLSGKKPNTQAVGAEITLETDNNHRQRCFYISQPGLAGGSELACHFGLGKSAPTRIEVRWPTGHVETFPVPTAARALNCIE